MHCPQCGKEVTLPALFCPNCGAKLPQSGPEKADATAVSPTPMNSSYNDATQANKINNTQPFGQSTARHAGSHSYSATQGSTPQDQYNDPAVVPVKKKPPLPLIAIVGVLLVAVVVFGVSRLIGGSGNNSAAKPQAKPTAAPLNEETDEGEGSGSSAQDGMDDSDFGRFKELVVSDIKIDTKSADGPKITCTVTNNQKQILLGSTYEVTGSFKIRDNYGDEKTQESYLDVFCTASDNGYSEAVPYLFPGKNTLEFIPKSRDNIVTTHTSDYTGETQTYRLDDLDEVSIDFEPWDRIDSAQYAVLTPDDYAADLKMTNVGSTPHLRMSLTNKTNYRWRSATAFLVAIGPDGQRAHYIDTEDNLAAFKVGPLQEEYFNVGETKHSDKLDTEYSKNLNVDHFEIRYIVVEKELQKSGENADE